ncbi:hypothetical protein K443DRAFT_13876, partial [Laccaria amethystina LaAM-08-1]
MAATSPKTAGSTFFPDIHKAWRDSWPVPAPTDDEIRQWGSAEIATAKLVKRAQERVVTWFHNNTRATSSSTGIRGVLKLGANQKLLHGWQAYQHLYYESFKADIESEYESYIKECEVTKEKPKTRFEFRNEACQKRFAEETEEVKAEVEEYQVKLRDGLDTNLPKDSHSRNKEIQCAIEKLPRTLDKIGQSIADQTKWQVMIIVGGPTPHLNGKLTTLICHFGKTTDGKTFEEFLGHDGYYQHLESTFELREKYGDVGLQTKKPTNAKTSRKRKDKPEGERHVSARLNIAGQSAAESSPTTSATNPHIDERQDAHLLAEGHIATSNGEPQATQAATNTASAETAASTERSST